MPAYNNYNAYGGQGVVNPRINNWNNGWNGYNPIPQQSSDGRVYVNGRAGADAYPLPNGINLMILWDTESCRFFVKGYDNNGMPRVLEDNDFAPHIEPESAQQPSVDMSAYATKEDIKAMISQAIGNISRPNMSSYVTQKEFDKVLSELSVGNGGRIVRVNESNE